MKPHTYSYRDDPAVPPFADDKPILVFDGYCALCAGWVQFVLKHDGAGRYRLLSAQSALGQALYVHYGLDPKNFESNILISGGVAWLKSESSIRMAEGLGFPWKLAALARVLPLRVRDALYERVAFNRLKWFGRRQTCYLPSSSFEDRFLG
jgi:predicted DCC family thiol-disulfide oxidoreductase YuxK